MSAAVNGLPSCHLTPCRSLKVSSVPSSLHDQLVARSGTIDFMLFCGSSCLYITRLLKTPIIGTTVEYVASSMIDMLAGCPGDAPLERRRIFAQRREQGSVPQLSEHSPLQMSEASGSSAPPMSY